MEKELPEPREVEAHEFIYDITCYEESNKLRDGECVVRFGSDSVPETGERSMGEITVPYDAFDDEYYRTADQREELLEQFFENGRVEVESGHVENDGLLTEVDVDEVPFSGVRRNGRVDFVTQSQDGTTTITVDAPSDVNERLLEDILKDSEAQYEYSMDREYFDEANEDYLRAKGI